MSWRTLTESDLLTQLSDTELQRIRAAATGDQPDPIAATLLSVTDTVRGYISAYAPNVLGPADTLPAELIDTAVALAVVRVWPRVGGSMLDPKGLRKDAHAEAMTLLRSDVATGKFRVRPPDSGSLPPGVGPQAELASSRTITTSPTNLDGLL
jgi:hypothetical protein